MAVFLRRRGIGTGAWAALALGAALLLALVAAAVWLAAVNAHALDVAARTEAISRRIAAFALNVENAESSQRGYLLTGSDAYLRPYEAAVPHLLTDFDGLAAVLPRDRDTQRLVAQLRLGLHAKLGELANTVALFREGDHAGALAVMRTGEGRVLMERIRELTGALAAGQDSLASDQSAAILARERLLVALDAGGVLLAGFLSVLVAGAVRRTLRALRIAHAGTRRAKAALERANGVLESEVARRTEELQSINEEVQRFAYIVSHDLRAPLVNIVGFTGELERAQRVLRNRLTVLADPDGAIPADLAETIERDLPEAIHYIQSSTARMDRLITAILRLSREGRRLLRPEPVNMAELIEGALETLKHQIQEAAAGIEIGALPDLTSDRLALEQVFANLLENAIKYRDPDRALRITVRGHGDALWRVYEIEDTGRGIAGQDQERVFELFRRAGPQDAPGDGVGLAHVRALVRRLGGQIGVESVSGRGSIFRIHLPAVLPPALDNPR